MLQVCKIPTGKNGSYYIKQYQKQMIGRIFSPQK